MNIQRVLLPLLYSLVVMQYTCAVSPQKVKFELVVEWIPKFCAQVTCIPNVNVNKFTTHSLWRSTEVAEKDDPGLISSVSFYVYLKYIYAWRI